MIRVPEISLLFNSCTTDCNTTPHNCPIFAGSRLSLDRLSLDTHRSGNGRSAQSHSEGRSACRPRSHGIACRMSRKGTCWDNAGAESFFATLKKELIYRRTWTSRLEARNAIAEYIELFSSCRRRRSSLA